MATLAATTGSSQALVKSAAGQTWVDAMQLGSLQDDMPQLLVDMGAAYDPNRLAAEMGRNGLALNVRAVRIASTLGGFITSLLRDYASGSTEANVYRRADEFQAMLARLGPSFVKVGQALSARPDLLPKPYLDALAQLQDQLPPFDTETALALIQRDFGAPASEIFSELSATPVAAASLGQVYRGRLASTGEEVAVKVQRPQIGEAIASDMVLLRRFIKNLDQAMPRLTDLPIQPLLPLVDEFAGRLFGELDYIQEGQSCEKFADLYAHVPRVRTPQIIWEVTSRQVLTMEWIDGVKLTDEAKMAAAGLEIVDFVNVGIQCTLRQLLEAGFFHADPHPGNLLATKSGDLVYLDFGMMSTAPEKARYAIINHVTHLVNRDYDAMCRDYYELEFLSPEVDSRPIAPELARFFDEVLDRSVSELNFRAIVDGLGDVLFKYPFRVPPFYALILRSLTVLEGLALTADPNYKLLGAAYPYMARRILLDPAPELRSSLAEMVLHQDGRFRWSRLDNLLREGSKSSALTSDQLWLLGEYLCSDNGTSIRVPLVEEMARLIDAYAADRARDQVAARAGRRVAERIVPVFRGERILAVRALRLLAMVNDQYRKSGAPPLQVSGSGPWGLMMPGEVASLVERVQAAVAPHWPRLQTLLTTPGAVEARGQLVATLRQRLAARTVRLVLGYNEGEATSAREEQVAGAASSPFNIPGRRSDTLATGIPAK